MTESNDSPSLFPEESITTGKKTTRRKTAETAVKAPKTAKTAKSTKADESEAPVAKTTSTRTRRVAKAAASEEKEEVKAPVTRARRVKAAVEAPAEETSEAKPRARRTKAAAAESAPVEEAPAPRKRVARVKAVEEAPAVEEAEATPRRRVIRRKSTDAVEETQPPVASVPEEASVPVRKPRGRPPKAAAPAIPVRPPGKLPEAEEWAPGNRAAAETKAPVEPVQTAKSTPPAGDRSEGRRPFAYENRDNREAREHREPRERDRDRDPRENREGAPREHREGGREGYQPRDRDQREGGRDNRDGGRDNKRGFNRRDRFNNRRDRDHRGNRGDFRDRDRDRQDQGNREPRDNRDNRDNRGDNREQRIAAARQEFSNYPEPASDEPPVFAEGIVEVSGKGFGFLRDPKRNFAQHPNDIFVTPEVCRRYPLRDGMWIKGEIRRGNRGMQLYKLTEIEGEDPDKFQSIPMFEELTTINPNRVIKLETTPERYTTRVIDLMAPIGRGQRGLIVAPPRTGKTTLLQHVAEALIANHPDMKLIVLLVDERPEEVTEIRRSVPGAEVMASSNDMDLKSHTRIAQFAIERAKRLVEMGKHVFVLLDSITRVGRAFNNAMSGGGRTMSGGVDARALEIPRKLFAAARNTEEAGSLTIVATALIETGSRMDDLIFQEFKGTGNMELVLDRRISDLRIYPAVDIFQSGTRREELLLPESDLHKINIIRRGLAGHKPAEAIERLLSFLRKFPTNSQMLREIPG